MNKIQTFQEFLATQSTQVPIFSFVFNLLLAALFSFILSQLYIKYAQSLSNRRMFAKNFMLITMTTMFIITVVKSSLALSLGLVGALSIVRFRTAIKEPEELAYLFFSIGIGLGLGADQRVITLISFLVIVIFIYLFSLFRKTEGQNNLYLTITNTDPKKIELNQIIKILEDFCSAISLRRFDETKDILEAVFLVEYDNFDQLTKCRNALQNLSRNLKISFLDNRGVW